MAGIGLDAGYGAAGAASGLQELIANRLMRDKLTEAIRAQQAQEEQRQQEIDASREQSAWMHNFQEQQARTAAANRLEDIGTHKTERTEDRALHTKERGEDVAYRGQQAATAAEQAQQRFDIEGQRFGEDVRHNRAIEGIDRDRIAASGGNRTVQVRRMDPTTGQEVVEFLTPQEARARGAMQAPPTAAAKKAIADTQASLDALENIRTLYKPEFVGPLAGRMGSFENYTGIGIKPERAQFQAAVAALKNQVIKDITGAQMSESEARRIMEQIPDVNNPPEVFQARMMETQKNRERIRQAMGAPAAQATPAAASAIKITSIKPVTP